MIYKEYYDLKMKFKEAENNYYEALTKRSDLLYTVTPHGTEVKEIMTVSHGNPGDKMINFADKIGDIDELIGKTRNDKDMLNYLLKKKEIELRASSEIHDRIFVYKWLENRKVHQIYRYVDYSRRQVYRYIEEIKEEIYKK